MTSSTSAAACSKTYVESQLPTAWSFLFNDLSKAFMFFVNCRMPGTDIAVVGG